MYMLSTGCQWRRPAQGPAAAQHGERLLRPLEPGRHARSDASCALCAKCRERRGREASPTAAIIDSQSVKGAEKGGADRSAGLRRAARRSRARSGMCWSTRRAADAGNRPCRGHPGSRWRRAADGDAVRDVPLPAQALRRWRLPGAEIPTGAGAVMRRSTSRSSNGRDSAQASSCCPSDGSWSAPSPGSTAVAASPRTGNASTATRSPSCGSAPSASCSENYAIPHDVLGQTLECLAAARLARLRKSTSNRSGDFRSVRCSAELPSGFGGSNSGSISGTVFRLSKEQMPLQPVFDTFGSPAPVFPSINLAVIGVPLSRLWFLNENQTELLQFQSDRFGASCHLLITHTRDLNL